MLNRCSGYLCLFVFLAVGCAASPNRVATQSESPRTAGTVPAAPVPRDAAGPAASDPTGAVTLRDVLSLALLKNPELSGASWEIRAGEARAIQAGVLPNPEFGVTIEEFGGNKLRKNLDAAQTTIQLSQLIELGGKRAARLRLAKLEKELAGWDYEVKRMDVLTGASKAFVEVLAAQELESLSAQLVDLAERVLNSVSERVKAGKVSPLEETKSSVAASTARIEREKARSNLRAARYKLAASWGQEFPTFERADGVLDDVRPIPSIEDVRGLISRNPDVARYVKELEQRSAALDVQRARGVPDLTLSGGVQRFSEDDETAFVVGLTIPIPIFDRNRGGIMEAGNKLSKAKEEYRAARVRASSGLGEAFYALEFAHSEVLSLKNDVLPAAEHAFDASQEAFREGKFDFLDLLDAQRTLFTSKIRYIESLATYHKAVAELERLTGERFDSALDRPAANPNGKGKEELEN